MRAFKDKTTGLWKWGSNGVPKYESRIDCEKAGLRIVTDKLRDIRQKVDKVVNNHGMNHGE